MADNPHDELSGRRIKRQKVSVRRASNGASLPSSRDNLPGWGASRTARPTQTTTDHHQAAEVGGECLCGRGQAIGTCTVAADRLWFRSFHEAPTAYHLMRVLDWACVDCVADAALDVANGVVRERMREMSRQRATEMEALQRTNVMRLEAGLPIVNAIIPDGCDEWPGGER